MSTAATIIFAREDLSIPGAAGDAAPLSDPTDSIRHRFFELVDRAQPDVIVLDFTRLPANGAATILTIRERTDIPILVVCNPEPPFVNDYRIAGAADCIAAPIDIIGLHQAIQNIMLGIELTSSEGRLLTHFLSKPRALCTRGEIAELLYGPRHGVGERAIDVLVNRLRKKLAAAGGDAAQRLIRTEFRRGYALVAEVASLAQEPPAPPHAR
jgi:DNA-binding response OmpR family regulator